MPIIEDRLKKFFYYICEREQIRLRKESGQSRPWTDDRILNKYGFTNVKRSDDRTTRAFKKMYDNFAKTSSREVTLFNCAIARYVGTAEFMQAFGWSTNWNRSRFVALIESMRAAGVKVFTSAYVIPNQGIRGLKSDVVADVLEALWPRTSGICNGMAETKTWSSGVRALASIPGFGGKGFMAKEVLQDYLLTCHGKGMTDAETWTPMGPGARRGVNRLTGADVDFDTKGGDDYWLKVCLEVRARAPEFTKLKLTAHDVQFCLCEFDKYCRAGEGGHLRRIYRERES